MKKIIFTIIFAGGLPSLNHTVQAQSINDILGTVSSALNGGSNNNGGKVTANNSNGNSSSTPLSYLTNSDITSGLRQALQVGARNATNNLSQTNGFFGNQLIKILMPPEVSQIENRLRQFGFGNLTDKLVMSMNRAAEDASKQALPILVNAITSFSIQDGMTILKGGNTAATDLLRIKTSSSLAAAFRPVIAQSMGKFNVQSLWNSVFTTYNTLPIIKNKVNTDLTGYVTDRALSGLFTTIGQEEKKIRIDPASAANSLIQKVFSAK
jgi:hypothetical protein